MTTTYIKRLVGALTLTIVPMTVSAETLKDKHLVVLFSRY